MARRSREASRHRGRHREVTSDVRIVDVSGSPRELGRAHGEEMRSTIATGLQGWFAVIEPRVGMSGQAYVATFLEATDFLDAIE